MPYYKYLPPDRTGVIRDGKIRFTQFSDLNDPFEAAPSFVPPGTEYLSQMFDELLAKDSEFKSTQADPGQPADLVGIKRRRMEFINRASQPEPYAKSALDFQKHLSDTHGVLSLSKVKDSMLQWSHYCEAHKGFVVEFDDRHGFFKNGAAVIYSAKRPPLTLKGSHEQFHIAVTTKCQDWAYEQEVRFFQQNLGLCDERVPRDGKPDICLFRFPPDAVISIILGWRISLETHKILEAALELPHYRHVRMMRAEPHATEFRMQIGTLM